VQGIRVCTLAVSDPGERVIELYDLGTDGVLVMESGLTEGRVVLRAMPGIDELLKAHRFADVLANLRPDLSVPPALRRIAPPPANRSGTSEAGRIIVTAPEDAIGIAIAPRTACGGSDDDDRWLMENVRSKSDRWFYQDHGWSWRNAFGASCWSLTACTATSGTSVGLDVEGRDGRHHGSWEVAPGRYHCCWWEAGRLACASLADLGRARPRQEVQWDAEPLRASTRGP